MEPTPQTVTPDLIVGTWKDVGTQSVETYNENRTVVSHMNETISIPLNESGFTGIASIAMQAKASGSWTFSRGQLIVTFDEIHDLILGEVSVKVNSNPFGAAYVEGLAEDLRKQLHKDIQEQFTGQSVTLYILSVSEKKLVTRDEDDEIEELIRINN